MARARRKERDELGRRRHHLREGGHAGVPTGEEEAGLVNDGSDDSSNRRDWATEQLEAALHSQGWARSYLSRVLLPKSQLSTGAQRAALQRRST